MNAEELSKFKKCEWMQSRIPVRDALAMFVPQGQEGDPTIQKAVGRQSISRWYPVEGGHRVLIEYDGRDYDKDLFTIEKGGFDHEHCDHCSERIEPMALCWVTKTGHYVILCVPCYKRHIQRPWWRFW